jgi:hypothetical protein
MEGDSKRLPSLAIESDEIEMQHMASGKALDGSV